MKILFCVLVAILFNVSARPNNIGSKLRDVIKEAKSLNDLIAIQLDELDIHHDAATDLPTTPDTATDTAPTPDTATDTPTTPDTATDTATTPDAATDTPTTPNAATDTPTTPDTATDTKTTPDTATDTATTPDTATDTPTTPNAATDTPTTPDTATNPPTSPDTVSNPATTPGTATNPATTPDPFSGEESGSGSGEGSGSGSPTTPHSAVQTTGTSRPIAISRLVKKLSQLKESRKNMVKLYWSIFTIREMIEKQTLKKENNASMPSLLPESGLVRLALKRLKEVAGNVKKTIELLKDAGYDMNKPPQNEKYDAFSDPDETMLPSLLDSEMIIGKAYWKFNTLIEILKKVKEMKKSHTTPSGIATTPHGELEKEGELMKKFIMILHEAEKLPGFRKKLEDLKDKMEEKEKKIFHHHGPN